MINVSFTDLAIGSELPAPRASARPADASAFATMMDETQARQASSKQGEDRPDVRDTARPSRANSSAHRHDDQEASETASMDATPAKAPSPAAESQDGTAATGSAPAAQPANGKDTTPDTASSATPDDTTNVSPPQAAETATDATQVASVLAAAMTQTPAQPAPAQPSFDNAGIAPVIAPQAASPTAPAAGSDQQTQPAAQPSSPATMPTAPAMPSTSADTPVPPTAGEGAAPAVNTANSNQPSAASQAASAFGEVMPETPAAMNVSSQPASADPTVVPPPVTTAVASHTAAKTTNTQTAPQVAPSDRASVAAAAAHIKLPEMPSEAMPREANAAPQTATAAASVTTQPSTGATASQQATPLAALLAAERIEIDLSQTTAAPSSMKPAPALANGMVAQIGAVQAADGQTKAGTTAPTTIGPVDGAAAGTSVQTQTMTAVAAAATIQAAADEPRQKLAAPDGLVINAPAPTTGAHASHTTAPDAVGSGKSAVSTPPAFEQVAVHVAKAAADGLDKINIKLKPATLGQIEVQLEVASDGRVHAVIAADKAETLDLLQRDARALERALGDAGLRTDSGSLSFNLRGQSQQQSGDNGFARSGGTDRPSNDIALPRESARLGAYLNARAAAGGVDIRV